MKETRYGPHTVYGWGRWGDKYGGRFCIYARPEGHVLIYMETFPEDAHHTVAGLQHVDFEMVHGGKMHRMVQRRTASEQVTETGALRIATRWAKSVATEDGR